MKTDSGTVFKHKEVSLKEGFMGFGRWLNEQHQKPASEPRYGCIMMDADIKNWKEYHTAGIEEDDVFIPAV